MSNSERTAAQPSHSTTFGAPLFACFYFCCVHFLTALGAKHPFRAQERILSKLPGSQVGTGSILESLATQARETRDAWPASVASATANWGGDGGHCGKLQLFVGVAGGRASTGKASLNGRGRRGEGSGGNMAPVRGGGAIRAPHSATHAMARSASFFLMQGSTSALWWILRKTL